MNAFDEQSRSLWMDTVVADAPSLTETRRVDTVVVGSGIAGLSAAYELACRGLKVLVLDRGRIAGGMTSRTSAHLTSQSEAYGDEQGQLHRVSVAMPLGSSSAAPVMSPGPSCSKIAALRSRFGI